jgi:hypothetical protein
MPERIESEPSAFEYAMSATEPAGPINHEAQHIMSANEHVSRTNHQALRAWLKRNTSVYLAGQTQKKPLSLAI